MPKSRKLIWQVFPCLVAILFFSLVSITLYAAGSFRSYYLESTRADLVSRAVMFARMLADEGPVFDPATVNALCRDMGRLTPARFTVVLPTGKVIGDSYGDPGVMENHSDRPEVQRALEGGIGAAAHFSFTTRKSMIYAAVPIRHEGRIIGVVRTSLPSTIFDRTLQSFFLRVGLGMLVITIIVFLFGAVFSLRIRRTFREMKRGADRFSSGDLEHRLHITSFAEIVSLAEAMNSMAEQLNTRIQIITSQRNELEAVLASMMEAVLALDADERIINCNHAAESLFAITLDAARGRTIQEVIRNSRLQHFVRRVLESGESISEDTILQFRPDRYLHAHGTLLCDASGRAIGALIVLDDVTRLKRLENIRRDFVANVSHELKTPITSIKGFVETLRDGTLNDPEAARRFLEIILKHADRLDAIIEDLLSLSRIEQEAENEAMRFETVRVNDVLKNAVMICERKASDKGVKIVLVCPEGAEALGNPALLEQAVVNLLDNAIKYSGPDSRVLVEAAAGPGGVTVKVEDTGIGIPEQHLDRIFERFYRVDKGRSRDMGGTGLGLAIVKHIVHAHNGTVTVTSATGKGSAFTIHLPAAVGVPACVHTRGNMKGADDADSPVK